MLRIKGTRRGLKQLRNLALTGLWVSLLLAVFPGSANTDRLIQIAPGSSISAEITPGIKEIFWISVEQEKLLRFSIEKGDLALSTVLHGPTGEKLFEHVSQELEVVEVSFVARTPGVYKIELLSRETTPERRPYELRVASLRPITELHRRDSKARQELASAEVLRSAWTAVSSREAIEKFDNAALIWISISHFSDASLATLRSGDVCFRLSEYGEAVKRYKKSALLAERVGDRMGQGRALSQMGRVYSYLGDNDLAKKQLTGALNLLKLESTNSNPAAKNAYGEALSNMGEVSYSRGNLVKALGQFEEARKLFDHNRENAARTHLFAAYVTGSMGNPSKALSEASQALKLYRAINNKIGEGLALTTLGLFHSSQKKEDRARPLHLGAIQLFRAVGDRHSEAIALTALGQSFENLHEYTVALDKYDEALRLFESIGALDLLVVTTFKVAAIHRLTDNIDKALVYYQRGLTLSRTAGKVRTEANALNEIASVYASQGNNEQASKNYRRLKKFYEGSGDWQAQALMLNNYGNFLLGIGQQQRALNVYREALLLSEKAGDNGILIATLHNLARVYQAVGKYETALSFIERSLTVIADTRANVGSPDLRASYVSGVGKHYHLCIDILMQLERVRPAEGFSARALLVSERNRARSLQDFLKESQADLRKGAPAELLDRERELGELIRALALYELTLNSDRGDAAELEDVVSQMAELRAKYQELQVRLREDNPHAFSLTTLELTGLEQIQNHLRAGDTMLLEYSLGDERSYLWAVTSDSFHHYELPSRKIIEDAAREVYEAHTARQKFGGGNYSTYEANVDASEKTASQKGSRLSQMLLGPVAEQLGNRRLILVIEGALQYVPFDALPVSLSRMTSPVETETPSRPYLIETNEYAVLPSMSTLVAMRATEDRPASPGRIVAVIADPVFSPSDDRVQSEDLPPAIIHTASDPSSPQLAQSTPEELKADFAPARLIHSSEEADAILAVAPRGTTMIARGFEASRETAMSSRIGEYQIVHFATHGFLDSERPELSSIVLSMVDQNGVKKNGLMPLHDIYSLDLSAELTVLSGCQTALGKEIMGEGLVGLSHSFMSAGSKSVVASLWKVDDRATAVLMSDFYESMLSKGLPPAAALRAAKLKMMQDKRWSAPYYWAGFVFQGDYDSRIEVQRNSPLSFGLALLSLVLISSGLIVFLRRRRVHLRS